MNAEDTAIRLIDLLLKAVAGALSRLSIVNVRLTRVLKC